MGIWVASAHGLYTVVVCKFPTSGVFVSVPYNVPGVLCFRVLVCNTFEFEALTKGGTFVADGCEISGKKKSLCQLVTEL